MAVINKVVATVWYNKENMYKLRRVFPEARFVYVDFFDKEKLEEEVKDADAVILMGDVDPCLLGENTLKWIHCDHAGLNGSARPEVFARGIPVTGAAGRSAPVLAEHTIYFMLMSCYHTREMIKAQENCQWGVENMTGWRGLYGRTAGIIGFGNNGRMLADRLCALGMKIIAYNDVPIEGYDYLYKKVIRKEGGSLDTLLEESDFVLINLPLNEATYHLINKDTISKMKDGAFLVNMARGGIVCTEDLIEALKSGKLGGAGLDVFEEQPLNPESPLWKMENVYITPHNTPQVPDRDARSIEIIRENARRLENGEPLINLMKPSDAMSGEKAEGGWAKMMNSKIPKEMIKIEMLEKFLGKRGWTDVSEWM